jgi:hypothetical protein
MSTPPLTPRKSRKKEQLTDKNSVNTAPLVVVTYAFMYTRQSPLFIGHGQDLKIEVASLGLSIDEEAVTRLTPFLESLSKEMNSSTPPIANDVLVVPKDVALVPKVASIYPIGMLITASIGSVALSLMRTLEEPVQKSLTVSKQLETAFTIKIMDLYAKVDMRKYNAADVKLRSFTIMDCRQLSEKYAYREILCNSTLGSQHDSNSKTTRYFDIYVYLYV